MGFLDKIFNGRKKDNQHSQLNQEKLDQEFNKLKSELERSVLQGESAKTTEDPITRINAGISALDNTSARQDIKNSISEQARLSKLEVAELEFSQTHATVQKFRTEFLAKQIRKKMGITGSEQQSSYMKKFEILRTSGLVDDRYLDKIFLPYLIEKKCLGIIAQDEEQELNIIMGATGKIEDMENATTQESYTSDFNNALIILGAIGVIELKEFAPCEEFPNGRAAREFSSMGNLEMHIEANKLANKIYTKEDKTQLTPAAVAKNALSQTARTKTEEATHVEQLGLNPANTREGETKDD